MNEVAEKSSSTEIKFEVLANNFVLPQRFYWPRLVETDVTAAVRAVPPPSFDGGVFDPQGKFQSSSRHIGRGHRHQPRETLMPLQARRLRGTWLYGGMLRQHFGHFMLECLGRLWASDPKYHGRRIAGVVYFNFSGLPRKPIEGFDEDTVAREALAASRKPYIREMVELLTEQKAIVIAGPAVQVEELIVPQQIAGESAMDSEFNSEAFREFVQERLLRRFGPRRGSGRLYVSRSRLKNQTASPVLEQVLELNLVVDGYEIVYPERLSLIEQLEKYYHAETILGSSGSALHLAAMCADKATQFGVISRQPVIQPKFTRQAREMGAERTVDFAAAHGEIRPCDPADGSSLVWKANQQTIVLDLKRIWPELYREGFVGTSTLSVPDYDKIVGHYVNCAIMDMNKEQPLHKFQFRSFNS